jgi:hypothetical protein
LDETTPTLILALIDPTAGRPFFPQGFITITYRLKGIAEGLAGTSYVKAHSVSEIFKKFPILEGARHKTMTIRA